MSSRPARAGIPKPTVSSRENILDICLGLFAGAGFDGVSMRDVAQKLGVTPAALYYHFRDKEELYLATTAQAFETRFSVLLAEQLPAGDAWTQLDAFVTRLCVLLAKETDLQQLIQRVMLDTDEERSQKLVTGVFQPFYATVAALAEQACPGCDAYRFANSVFALVLFPFESARVARFFPGFHCASSDPEALARHVMSLLKNGLQAV